MKRQHLIQLVAITLSLLSSSCSKDESTPYIDSNQSIEFTLKVTEDNLRQSIRIYGSSIINWGDNRKNSIMKLPDLHSQSSYYEYSAPGEYRVRLSTEDLSQLSFSGKTHSWKFTTAPKLKSLHLSNIQNETFSLQLPHLEQLFILDSKIKALDISQCQKLNGLTCMLEDLPELNIDKNLELRSLHCITPKLKEISFKGNKNIGNINLNNNNIERLTLGDIPYLSTIDIANNQLNKETIESLLRNLPEVKGYRRIDISKNPGSKECDIDLIAIAEKKGWQITNQKRP